MSSKKESLEKKIKQKEENLKKNKYEDHQQHSQEEEDLDEQSEQKPKKEINSDGEAYWSLAKNKRLSVGVFKGNVNINLREYFQKDGQWLPTKKGITLNPQSWKILKSLVKSIDQQIQRKKTKK